LSYGEGGARSFSAAGQNILLDGLKPQNRREVQPHSFLKRPRTGKICGDAASLKDNNLPARRVFNP
jgi:hypothetical protein